MPAWLISAFSAALLRELRDPKLSAAGHESAYPQREGVNPGGGPDREWPCTN
jgi:hypothetical protein